MEELKKAMKPERYVGRAPWQVEEFLAERVTPVLQKYAGALSGEDTELTV
jgi:adenylosuccinate lyase